MGSVYVLRAECGDYYCGCGGGHILGVFSTRGAAEAVDVSEYAHTYYRADGSVSHYRKWIHGADIEEYTLDVIEAHALSEVTDQRQ